MINQHTKTPREKQKLYCYLLLAIFITSVSIDDSAITMARELYRSNAVGVIIEELPIDTSLTESGYILAVDEDDQERTELLYRDGALIQQIESRINDRTRIESIYRSDILSERNSYDSDNRLLSKTSYDGDGKQRQLVRYTYSTDGVTVEQYDGDDELVFREQQTIDQNGRVTAIMRDYADGSTEEVLFIFLNRRLLREIHRLDDLELILKYDPNGRLIEEERHIEGELQRNTKYTYGEQSIDRIPDTVSITEIDGDLTTRIEQTNNESGQAIEQFSYENDLLVEEAIFRYEQGTLRLSRIQRTGSTSQQELVYNESGEQTEERWYENGELVRSVSNTQENETVELRYVDGQPYVRVFFSNGTRIKEEFLTEDEVIRERVLE